MLLFSQLYYFLYGVSVRKGYAPLRRFFDSPIYTGDRSIAGVYVFFGKIDEVECNVEFK